MPKTSTELIFEALRRLSVALKADETKERLQLYTEYLIKKYEPKQIAGAIERSVQELKFFPSLSELIKFIEEPVDIETDSQIMAGEILDAAKQFGQYRAKEAREAIGVKAWFSVERFGGWDTICNLTYDQLGTARAQLKNVCKSAIRIEKYEPKVLEPYDHKRRATTRIADLVGKEFKQLES